MNGLQKTFYPKETCLQPQVSPTFPDTTRRTRDGYAVGGGTMGKLKKYNTDHALRREVERYFDSISRIQTMTELRDTGARNNYGHPTIGGLCRHLGISQETWRQYCRNTLLADAARLAKEKLLAWKELQYQKAACQWLGELISEHFSDTMVITLHCSSSVKMPTELAKKVFRSWKLQAQRIAGSPFNFVRIVDYGPHPVPDIVFYVVADLPKDVCLEICEAWYMGKVAVARLDERGIDKLAQVIVRQKRKPVKPYTRLWSYSPGSRRSPTALFA